MGIENRGYMGGDPYQQWRSRQAGGRWTMVTTLIVINVVVFILQTLNIRTHVLEEWLALDTSKVLQGQIWRLTTYDFLHDTSDGFPAHLLFNMLLLFIAGRRVEEKYGRHEFLAFYLVAGVLSGIFFMLWGMLTQGASIAIGASGAAVAVMIVYACNWPHDKWYIWGILPLPVVVIAGLSAAFDLFPMIQQLAGNPVAGRTAHAAHAGGMLFGLLYAKQNWRISDWFSGWDFQAIRRATRRRPKLRVHVPDIAEEAAPSTIPADIERRLDAVLEKISQHGEASLNDDERKFLQETSRRYRNRR